MVDVTPYVPGPVPTALEGLPRYLQDELNRIADRMQVKVDPVVMRIRDSDTGFVIGTLPGAEVLFIGVTPETEFPQGMWDATTGTWTCYQDALYAMSLEAQFYNITSQAQGEIQFYAEIEVNGVVADIMRVQSTVVVGQTAVPLGITRYDYLNAGDTVRFLGDAVSTGQAQLADVGIAARISREAL